MSRIEIPDDPEWDRSQPTFRGALAELIEAAKEVLKGGAHEGPCSKYAEHDGCTIHVATAKERKQRLTVALDAIGASTEPLQTGRQ